MASYLGDISVILSRILILSVKNQNWLTPASLPEMLWLAIIFLVYINNFTSDLNGKKNKVSSIMPAEDYELIA